MSRVGLILLLSTTAVFAQTKSPAMTDGSKEPSTVPATAAVITIHRPCAGTLQGGGAAWANSCAEVVSRQQFDIVMDAVQAPTLLPAERRRVAQGYADLLIHSAAAMQAGMDQDPRYQQLLRLARMRALTDLYRIRMQEQARKISSTELQDYYRKNLEKFEELQLRRITLPRNNVANLEDAAFRARARRIADQVRARAARGEDMDKLQKEAFDSLGVKSPPPTLMTPVRRGAFDADVEAALLSLKPGQSSAVVEQPSVYIIYKLESRKTLTFDEAKAEISQTLYRRKLEEQTKALNRSVEVDYNEQYLGPEPASAWVSAGSRSSAPRVTSPGGSN